MALYGTMVKIETVTVGSGGQAAITFSSIPQTYTDLQIVTSCRSTASAVAVSKQIKFNGSSSNLSSRRLFGSGSSTTSDSFASNLYIGIIPGATATASTFSNDLIYIPNYTGSTNKSVSADSVSENNATEAYQALFAGLWSNTAAITSIELSLVSGNFAQHSTATLYGISRTTAQIKATGGTVYDDASYVYHLFTSSGTFTPSQALTADVLVVAGGGGGGGGGSTWANAGGGGAGGLLAYTSQSLTAQNYTVTIGAGGTGGVGYNTTGGSAGGNSQFGSLTASTGGGFGGGWDQAGTTGGSGGGGAGYTNIVGNSTGRAGTSGQGFAGGNGNGTVGVTGNGGGGGGAGAVGQAANVRAAETGGNGGAGSTSYTAWATATSTGSSGNYAGGGGGGAGTAGKQGSGTDGGGNGGGGTANGSAGTTNTGGGGGGAGAAGSGGASNGGAGGSGIVIVRYAK